MWDLLSMWKSPKMIGFMALTALLYFVSLFPFQGFTTFGGYADFGRVGVGIPVAFSFLFGPAAAWGAALGNVLRDIVEGHVDASSVFGFVGNLIIGYVPYKMWNALTTQKPDLKSAKKLVLFVGIASLACILCGVTIGWGLYELGFTPFMPTAAIIAITNMLWAITVGAILLSLTYGYVSKHKLLYTDILHKEPTNRTKNSQLCPSHFRYQHSLLFHCGFVVYFESFSFAALCLGRVGYNHYSLFLKRFYGFFALTCFSIP